MTNCQLSVILSQVIHYLKYTQGPNSGSTYVHLGPNNRRTDRKPSLTSIHFGDRAERYSSSTPRGAKSPGFDCENKSTSQLPQAYMTMHSPLSDTTSKSALIASIKQLERGMSELNCELGSVLKDTIILGKCQNNQ